MNAIIEREIFDAALEITDEAERATMIDRACADDPQSRLRIERLVTAHVKAETFFSECAEAIALSAEDFLAPDAAEAARAAIIDDAVGSRLGPYKLLQKIGEGGCGAVYMAEQDEPVRRRVALKIIKLGMDTRSVVARFEAERQALAMMEHPSIARVLDAGATETGRPFFVMELVNGIRITEYCNARKLLTHERLELFIEVCHAIQHAHQKGIIHRDIKPSNILVTVFDGAALPKVIDFGIAKAIEEKLTEKTMFTPHGHFIGTPAYMSPEQAQMNALDVDTRSDIYSLGVLLYELLTGKTPFDQTELLASGIDEMRRTLREKEPPWPSTRVNALPRPELTTTAQQRNLEPQELLSDLKGDLDWIVMKALEKDRSRRYQIANGLALDVRRYLTDEPVTARPPTRLYRLQKLMSRNKVVFAAGSAVAVALVVGFGFSTWMYFREKAVREEQVRLRQVADRALANEAALRREAEARATVAQATVHLSWNRLEQADELVRKLTPTSLHNSLEATYALRKLGEWHLLRGDLGQAAERFKQLLRANEEDNSWSATDDLLRLGPLLIETGDLQGYEHFRKIAIARFAGNPDPVFAERTLKISLLTPADEATLRSLEPAYEVAANSFKTDPANGGTNPSLAAWRCISLALMACRQNQMALAKEWCEKSFTYPEETPARIATAHIIAAMACHKFGEETEADSQLAKGQKLVEAELSEGIRPGDPIRGLWYDWLFARVLQREAEDLMKVERSVK